MGWATGHIERLKAGETVKFRPRGPSMKGRVASGALVTVEPVSGEVAVDEVVLCKVHGAQYLHIVKARQGDRYLIGNNVGGTNGWIGRSGIFGRMTKVEP